MKNLFISLGVLLFGSHYLFPNIHVLALIFAILRGDRAWHEKIITFLSD